MPAFSPPKENVGKRILYTSQSISLSFPYTKEQKTAFGGFLLRTNQLHWSRQSIKYVIGILT
jgi:hypothetical protein